MFSHESEWRIGQVRVNITRPGEIEISKLSGNGEIYGVAAAEKAIIGEGCRIHKLLLTDESATVATGKNVLIEVLVAADKSKITLGDNTVVDELHGDADVEVVLGIGSVIKKHLSLTKDEISGELSRMISDDRRSAVSVREIRGDLYL